MVKITLVTSNFSPSQIRRHEFDSNKQYKFISLGKNKSPEVKLNICLIWKFIETYSFGRNLKKKFLPVYPIF